MTAFYLSLSQHLLDTNFLRQLTTIGYLVNFQSLLSTAGDELGMIEDMLVGVSELTGVSFQVQ